MAYPVLPPVELTQGQDGQITVTLTDAAGAVVNVTGFAFQLTIREDANWADRPSHNDAYLKTLDVDETSWVSKLVSTALVVITPLTGVFGISVTRAQMSLLKPGKARYVADIWRTDSGQTYPVWGPVWVTVVSPAYPPA